MQGSISLAPVPVVDLNPQRKRHKSLSEIDPDVFGKLMNVYASDLKYNAYSVAEYLDISDRSFYNLVKKEPFKTHYEAAQARRAELCHNVAYDCLSETYVATKNGTAGDGQVAAAKNLANYMSRYAENLTLGPGNVRGDRAPKVNISIKLPDFNNVVGAVEVNTDNDEAELE